MSFDVEPKVWSGAGGEGNPPSYDVIAEWLAQDHPAKCLEETNRRLDEILDDLAINGGCELSIAKATKTPNGKSKWKISAQWTMPDLPDSPDLPDLPDSPDPDPSDERYWQTLNRLEDMGLVGKLVGRLPTVTDPGPYPTWHFDLPLPVLMNWLKEKHSITGKTAPHPLYPPVAEYVKHQKRTTGAERKVDYIKSKGIKAAKMPSVAMLPQAPRDLMVIRSEGEPVVSPVAVPNVRWKPLRNGQFDAIPRTLAKTATGDIVLEAMSDFDLDGRSTLKADLLGLSSLVFALTHPAQVSARELMKLFGWRPSNANLERLHRAVAFARSLSFKLGDGSSGFLFDLDALPGNGIDSTYHLAAGRWWRNGSSEGMAHAWRLSGMLFQPLTAKTKALPAGYWGTARRFLAGVESALQGGPISGKGAQGGTSEWVKSERKGGPGPNLFIPAPFALHLAGERCSPQIYRDQSASRKRFASIAQTLDELDYMCTTPNSEAQAGRTVEIMNVHSGRGKGTAGLTVRASARFVDVAAARGHTKRWDALALDRLIDRE